MKANEIKGELDNLNQQITNIQTAGMVKGYTEQYLVFHFRKIKAWIDIPSCRLAFRNYIYRGVPELQPRHQSSFQELFDTARGKHLALLFIRISEYGLISNT